MEFLRGTELFRGFTDTGLQILLAVAQQKSLPAGTPLFVENMLGDALYLIVDGRVRVARRGTDGREQFLMFLGPGESLGEASVLRSGPRMCSAIAESPARVLELSRRDLNTLQKAKPQAVLKLMMSIVDLFGLRLQDVDPDLRLLMAGAFGDAVHGH
jgi:CRP-like cAMP-binding protein